jgi:SOS-response transcriptional repressor LexA
LVGGEPDFSDSSIIIVDPTIAPLSGDFVVAKFGKGEEITFKRLIRDGGKD